MTVIRRYTGIFTCSFELYSYPFDVQVCGIDLMLPADYEGYVEFSQQKGEVVYPGKKELALFTVKSIRFAKNLEKNQLRCEFELHRRQGVILLTTFLPSVLLLSVSWATLFVKLKDLNVRAIMSLTTLLVLYTLFAQLSSSLPSTAAIKLIDIWFFFIIFLLFSNIMVHIFAERLGREETNTVKIEPKGRFQAWQARQPPAEKLLAVQRFVIIPGIIVIFNILFWWQVFTQ
ncbi:gamma-aminobutyric acid receptor subunit delta-like [Penaeus chinensis]|uniref:gamma-aminobutyric acid receptor subunit delta-like n=1 Tax=Penaeus chinensis TaxID=139456 RepID=UPI001FB7F5C9|nr:gamma-aminobutyric acid receptor subunit delta-like [Penaeus chinensis]